MAETGAHPPRELQCRVEQLDFLTHDIRRIRLEIVSGGPLVFSAGQYANMACPGQSGRDYSIASLPDDPGLEFHVRRGGTGSTSHFVLDELSIGDPVVVRAPMGSSFLREDHRGTMLCVAGGSGMAPMRCIVEVALHLDPMRLLHLYFGVRDERDIYFEERFRELEEKHRDFRFTPVLSEPSGATERRTGFVHEALTADLGDAISLEGAKAYIAGPPVMVETAVDLLKQRGLSEEDIHADAFHSDPAAATGQD